MRRKYRKRGTGSRLITASVRPGLAIRVQARALGAGYSFSRALEDVIERGLDRTDSVGQDMSNPIMEEEDLP